MLRRIAVLLALSFPAPAAAQSVIGAAAFFETASPASVRPGIGGGLAIGSPLVQLRISGRTGSLEGVGTRRFWQADADLKLAPLHLRPTLRTIVPLDAEPYLFVGGGTRTEAAGDDGGTRYQPSFSWGAGVQLPVIGRTGRTLALYGEARNRAGAWEARVGVGFRLSRRPEPAAVPVAAVPADALPAAAMLSDAAPVDAALADAVLADTALADAVPGDAVLADVLLAEAERYLGVPYLWGGESPETGFDCSGFVQFVYATVGIMLPRVSRDQATAGTAVPLDPASFRRGDLLFFARDGRRIHHVAIYAGDGRIIHSPNPRTTVRYDDLWAPESRWYRDHLVAVRRVY